jgi:phospholipase C
MIIYSKRTEWWRRAAVGASLFALLSNGLSAFGQNRTTHKADHFKTATPIKHVVVLIGENRTFDHLFATYVPRKGETVSNLLSKGIINAAGTPGPNFSLAQQFQAVAPFQTEYFISLSSDQKAPYSILPAPTLNFAPTKPVFAPGTPTSLLAAVEPSLETQDLHLLTTGAATQFSQTFILPDLDTRVQNFNNLPNGPFPLRGPDLPYDSYTGDTTHRVFEMWQQSNCNITNATPQNPSGCLNDLYPLVITNYTNQFDPFFGGIDDNGGGNSMAFYNVQEGDVPFLKRLTDKYSMSDNFHQSFMGVPARTM